MVKLKIIKNLVITIILVIFIDFIVSKIFKTEFSIYGNILIGIGVYIGCYLASKKKED